MLNRLLHLEQAIFSNVLIINCLRFSSVGTAAEVYGIRLLKAGSAAQPRAALPALCGFTTTSARRWRSATNLYKLPSAKFYHKTKAV